MSDQQQEKWMILFEIKQLVDKAHTDDDELYFSIADSIANKLTPTQAECLEQLVNGPVWDGDLISKSTNSELIHCDLAVRVCCRGEQGFTGSPYIGYTVLKRLQVIKTVNNEKQREDQQQQNVN